MAKRPKKAKRSGTASSRRASRSRSTPRARSGVTGAAASTADDPIPVGSACHPSVRVVLDDILDRKDLGWEFTSYSIGPEPNTIHLLFQ